MSNPACGDAAAKSATAVDYISTALAVLCCVAVVASVVVHMQNLRGFNHDVAWILTAADKLLAGGSIPESVMDNNPPLIYWACVPIVGLAHLTSLAPIVVYDAVVLLGCMASAAVVFVATDTQHSHKTLAVAVASSAFALLGCLPGYDFGQRDHLVVIAFLPYFALAALTDDPSEPSFGRLRLAVAVGLAFAISLKPHFALVWLAVEGYRYWTQRTQSDGRRPPWRRRENQLIAALGAIYIGAVVLFTPRWLDTIPITLNVYKAYEGHIPMAHRALPLLAVVVVWMVVHVHPKMQRLVSITLLSALCFYGIAVGQGMGFSYHFVPTNVAIWWLIALLLLSASMYTDSWRAIFRVPPDVIPLLVLAASLKLAGGAFITQTVQLEADNTTVPRVKLANLLRKRAHGGYVFVMSTSVAPAFPAINIAGVQSSSRFSCLWIVPGLYPSPPAFPKPFPYRQPDQMGTTEKYFVSSVIDDLQAHPPLVILDDRSPNKQALGYTSFDFVEYFWHIPRFRAFFKAYHRQGHLGKFDIYVRAKPQSP